ncbi:MAG: riboflavin kinase [Enterobacterales bacterium]|nr:riboflavin kinase [Enterobacterales bacterium]
MGIDRLFVLRFNDELSQMEAQVFIKRILIDAMQIKHLVVGDDFHFGHQRQGDFELLKQVGQGYFSIEPTPTVYLDGSENRDEAIRVSSTRIRQALAENDFFLADKLLGRRFSLCGKVHYGRQLGRTIGFPTANIALQRKNFPLTGVYWGRAMWRDPRTPDQIQSTWSVANCGVRPTVDGNNFKCEVHLLGMTAELYGIELAFEFFVVFCEPNKSLTVLIP